MNDLLKLVKDAKGNLLSWHLHYLLYGLFLFIILNFLYAPTSNLYPNWNNLSDFQKNTVVAISAYFFARSCNLIGSSFYSFILTSIQGDRGKRIRNWFSELKDFIGFVGGERRLIEKTNEINSVEFSEFTSNVKQADYFLQKYRQENLMQKTFMGFFLILGFVNSLLFLLIVLLFFLRTIGVSMSIRELRFEAAKYFREYKDKDSERKS